MLEMVLEEIREPESYYDFDDQGDGSGVNVLAAMAVELKGTVKSVVALEKGYDDPTGRTIYLELRIPDQESLDALHLTPGERYLVYGYDYFDGQWALRTYISRQLSYLTGEYAFLEELEDSCFSSYKESDLLKEDYIPGIGPHFIGFYNASGYQISLVPFDLRLRNAIFLTAEDKSLARSRKLAEDGGYVLTWERLGHRRRGKPGGNQPGGIRTAVFGTNHCPSYRLRGGFPPV